MEQNKKYVNCPSIGDYAPYLDGSEEFGEKVETVNIGFDGQDGVDFTFTLNP